MVDPMTAPEKKRLAYWLALLVASWPLLVAFDSRYVDHTEFSRVESKLDRVLDVACEGKEMLRACQP